MRKLDGNEQDDIAIGCIIVCSIYVVSLGIIMLVWAMIS